ncbi:hypothetical protein K501DRAFT_335128 [Backusella circina FSU 941]|nr:hypothetical protein K501DRAFT_335128 [Backusella circina FSU 941]
MSTFITRIGGFSRTYIHYRNHNKLYSIQQPFACLHTSPPWANSKEKSPELLPDQRFQELIAELEAPYINNTPESDLFDYLESFKPTKPVLETEKYNQLRSHLTKSFTVRQLSDYLEHKRLNKKGKKDKLISRILSDSWNIKSIEQLNEERRRKVLNTITKRFPATNNELFFIIGDNGSTIRQVEEDFDVGITIDVHGSNYMIQGPSNAVDKAKEAIHSKLDIVQEEMPIPSKVKGCPELEQEVKSVLADISKVSNAYISFNGDKFNLACRSKEAIEKAKTILSLALLELDMTDKKPLDTSDMTLTQKRDNECSLLPIHDASAMSVYSRRFGWSRIVDKTVNDNNKLSQYNVLSGGGDDGDDGDEGSGTLDLKGVKGKLLMPFSAINKVSIEARFGHVLFRNPDNNNILKPSIDSLLSISNIKNLLKERTQFFDAMPPHQLTLPFIPFTMQDGFFQRCVKLEYINKALLCNTTLPAQQRLSLEFHVDEQGGMGLKQAFAEKKRSVIDILGVSGNVDIRLSAKELDNYSNEQLPNQMQEMVNQCKLTGYSELEAPQNWVGQDNSQMTLLDVTFVNKKRYLSADNLVTVSHIQQQNSGIERTEVNVTPFSTDYNMDDMNNRWSSFTDTIYNIASKWRYSASVYE